MPSRTYTWVLNSLATAALAGALAVPAMTHDAPEFTDGGAGPSSYAPLEPYAAVLPEGCTHEQDPAVIYGEVAVIPAHHAAPAERVSIDDVAGSGAWVVGFCA